MDFIKILFLLYDKYIFVLGIYWSIANVIIIVVAVLELIIFESIVDS